MSGEEVAELLDRLRAGEAARIVASAMKIALFIELMNVTGLRVSECTGLKLTDLKNRRDKRGKLYVELHVRGKGRKERDVMVSCDLVKRIKETFKEKVYLFEYGDAKTYGRVYVSGQISKAGKFLLGRDISAHTLRHSFATRTLKEGKSLKAVSKYLGHSSTAVTADLYIHDELTWEDVEDAENLEDAKGEEQEGAQNEN